MRVVMTLPADDGDLLESQLLFHLHAGVEAAVVGGDLELPLGEFDGDARVHRVPDASLMTHAATAELGANWIIPAEAREFWWPRGGSLTDVLSAIPADYDVVQALVRPFLLPRSDDGEAASEPVYRLSAQAMLDDPGGSPRPARRLAHRAGVDVGSYRGEIPKGALRPLRGWYPIEVLSVSPRPVEPPDLARGLEDGAVQVDARLGDALRELRAGNEIVFARPTVIENAWFAVDAAVLGEADAFALRGDVDDLERRLADLEENVGVRAERKLRALLRRGRRTS
jgi:hypothetical protein